MSNLQELAQQYLNSRATSFSAQQNLALQKLVQYGLPSKKFENFKYTSFSNLNDYFSQSLKNQLEGASRSPEKERFKKYLTALKEQNDFYYLIFLDGQLVESPAVSGFKIETLSADVFYKLEEQVQKDIQTARGKNDSKPDLAARLRLATKPNHEGLKYSHYLFNKFFYRVELSQSLEKPIQAFYLNTTNEVVSQAVCFELAEGTQNQIIETHGQAEVFNESLQITQSFLQMRAGAKALHVIETLKEINNLYGNHITLVREECVYDQIFIQQPSPLIRQEAEIHFLEEKAEAQSLSCGKGRGKSHSDFYIGIYHHKGHNNSTQLFKNLLKEEAFSAFRGLVYMAPNAQKANSEQLNNNLLLSEKAEAVSLPQLEIYVDDVKAAHGSTTGDLNADEIFYLQSRAINKTQAIEMLSAGFLKEVVYKLKQTKLNKYLIQKLEQQ